VNDNECIQIARMAVGQTQYERASAFALIAIAEELRTIRKEITQAGEELGKGIDSLLEKAEHLGF
jgi:hypothetical protein